MFDIDFTGCGRGCGFPNSKKSPSEGLSGTGKSGQAEARVHRFDKHPEQYHITFISAQGDTFEHLQLAKYLLLRLTDLVHKVSVNAMPSSLMHMTSITELLSKLGSEKWALHLHARKLCAQGIDILELTIVSDEVLQESCRRIARFFQHTINTQIQMVGE